MKPRSDGQTLAIVVIGGVVAALVSSLAFHLLEREKERADRALLLGPIVPGHGSA